MSDKPILKPRDDGLWELVEDWNGIPAGYPTDGASVPRFLWRVLGPPFEADTIAAAIKHDWEYDRDMKSRAEIDAEFYHDLREHGVGIFRASLYWLGVRLFGGLYYGK